jgi:hypothetical protein
MMSDREVDVPTALEIHGYWSHKLEILYEIVIARG